MLNARRMREVIAFSATSWFARTRVSPAGGTMRIAIVNIGTIVSGDLAAPFADGDTIITEGDRIVTVGTMAAREVEDCDVVIDADGTTAIPGLIDSHGPITSGDFT